MDTVIIIFLFLAPGLAITRVLEMKEKRERKKQIKTNIYEQLFTICTLSIFTTGIACALVNLWRAFRNMYTFNSVSDFIKRLDTFAFLIQFIIALILAAIAVGWAYVALSKKYVKLKNKNIKEDFNLVPLKDDNSTVWDAIFLSKEKNTNPRIVSVYKDGAYITSGYIDGWNFAEDERKELAVIRTTEIEKIMKLKDRPLKYITEEYFDMETGVLIKFWESDEVNEHWEDIMENINKTT